MVASAFDRRTTMKIKTKIKAGPIGNPWGP
jgi:hypothetical protein